MTQAESPEMATESDSWTLHAEFADFELLQTGGVDVFLLDLNEHPGTAPFYVVVDGRRFALQRESFLLLGHGAEMPRWIREHEAEGRLVLLAERDMRYLAYVHDPEAEAEAEADQEEPAAE